MITATLYFMCVAPVQCFGSDIWAEQCLLDNYPQATRNGDTLTIKASAIEHAFTNNKSQRHVFADAFNLKPGIHVLVNHFYNEMTGSTIINTQTGDRLALPFIGSIVLAPFYFDAPRRYVIAADIDVEARYSPNVIKIINATDFQVEWEYDYDAAKTNCGASDPVWVNKTRIQFVENCLDSKFKLKRRSAFVQFIDNKWTGPVYLK
jgi:hypothetical protein